MSEVGMVSLSSFGDSPEDEETRLEAKLYVKPNCEVILPLIIKEIIIKH